MTVSSVTSASGASAASSGQQLAGKVLGQADFIRLMTTQMKLQDPLEPVDNKEMIAQMAQFSSLAGIGDINANLEAITARLDLMLAAQNAVQTPSTTA
jgi:flagellar basal-body rod modification protein FlgD